MDCRSVVGGRGRLCGSLGIGRGKGRGMCVSKRGHWGAIGVPRQEFPKGEQRRRGEDQGRNAPNGAKTDRTANPSKPLATHSCAQLQQYISTQYLTVFLSIKIYVGTLDSVAPSTSIGVQSNATLTNE